MRKAIKAIGVFAQAIMALGAALVVIAIPLAIPVLIFLALWKYVFGG